MTSRLECLAELVAIVDELDAMPPQPVPIQAHWLNSTVLVVMARGPVDRRRVLEIAESYDGDATWYEQAAARPGAAHPDVWRIEAGIIRRCAGVLRRFVA